MSGMSLVRGMTTTSTRTRKSKKKTASQIQAEKDHEQFLKKMGVGKTELPKNAQGKRTGIHDIPDYGVNRVTSDTVPGNGTQRNKQKYTGCEILGISLNHKSSFEPIRRDNKKAAVDSARMRRG